MSKRGKRLCGTHLASKAPGPDIVGRCHARRRGRQTPAPTWKPGNHPPAQVETRRAGTCRRVGREASMIRLSLVLRSCCNRIGYGGIGGVGTSINLLPRLLSPPALQTPLSKVRFQKPLSGSRVLRSVLLEAPQRL